MTASWAQSISALTLPEILDVAMARASNANYGQLEQSYQSSSWLAASPSVSLNYLGSDERYGTDETELSLNLPIKSGRRRKADKQLGQLARDYETVSAQARRLFVSGLIRESLWSYRLALVQLEAAGRKHQLLTKLEGQYQTLVEANAASEYSLLIIQKERVETAIDQSDSQRELDRWLGQYRLITGIGNMPDDIEESSGPDTQFLLASHPEIRALELGWQQKKLRLLANSNQAAPWNVYFTAKNVEEIGFEENQYGIGVEVPMSFLEIANETRNNEWLQESRDFERALDQMRAELQRRWEQISSETAVLQQKQSLLADFGELSARIMQRASELMTANELEQEIILRHQLEAIDAEMAVETNLTLLQQNHAMRLQAMGRPL
ncbi:MAG: hypothetical protein V7754_06635 [Halioglobus sp.]